MGPKNIVFNHEEINLTVWHSGSLNEKTKHRFIIFCHGLPSHPYQHNPAKVEQLIKDGFTLVYPYYKGTWASSGDMSWEGCTETIHQVISFLKKGKGINAYDERVYNWECIDFSIVGGSFGASVALVAGAQSEQIENIIAVAGPTDWRNHSRIPEESDEPIEDLYHSITRGWKNLWRIPSEKEWSRLATGEADLNPVDYIDKLRNKNILLIHGEMDTVVSKKRSEKLFEKIGKNERIHKLLILKKRGHLGNNILCEEGIYDSVIDFLGKNNPKK